MKLSLRIVRGASAFAALGLVISSLAGAASCASDDRESEHAAVVDDASVEAATPDADASCDGEVCTAPILGCAQADWCPTETPLDPKDSLVAVWGTAASDVWAAGSSGTALHYDGAKWIGVPTGTANTIHAIWGSSSNDVWFASSATTILHMVGAPGATSTFRMVSVAGPTAVGGRLLSISGTSATDVRMAGEPLFDTDFDTGITTEANHLLYAPRDGGAPYDLLSGFDGELGKATIHAISCRSAADVWVAVDDGGERPWLRGGLLRGTKAPGDGGSGWRWSPIDTQSTAPLRALWSASNGDVWAVGDRGVIRRVGAGAESATILTSDATANLRAVWGTSPTDVWIVGEEGTILHYDGNAFTKSSVAGSFGRPPRLLGVWGSGPNDAWIVGDGALLHFTGKKPGAEAP